MAKAKAAPLPATLGRQVESPNQGELAARLFVKSYVPAGGLTAEHLAKCAIEAAVAFCEAYETHRLTKE